MRNKASRKPKRPLPTQPELQKCGTVRDKERERRGKGVSFKSIHTKLKKEIIHKQETKKSTKSSKEQMTFSEKQFFPSTGIKDIISHHQLNTERPHHHIRSQNKQKSHHRVPTKAYNSRRTKLQTCTLSRLQQRCRMQYAVCF